ncbi:transport permease protein [Pseudomonas sp. Pc102]|uniref:ABC transporter permease n=1 Tax=Pseudomonas sp. Pc102 TaxID=2678261 RepID=UPI001BCD965D|nr:ABC transporter permease [Pseudomonas sp. Pc102]BBP86043.1 transport permease protein [Pseudomonas sp. Pc102]
MTSYLSGVWYSRHFWIHLSLADLRSRWRRSFFGLLWSIIQPLGMTALLAVVFSKLFNTDIITYAPYILSGIIIWECITACVTGGSLSFVQADAYIKQCRHPLAIYTLRTVLTSLIVLALASLALLGWSAIVLPEHFGWPWLAAFSIFPMLALILWPLSTLLAYIGTRFRDVPHATGLIMQALWFISPVYFETKLFRQGGLDGLVDYNPIYHLLQLVRAPLLNGEWPTFENYAFPALAAAIFLLLALIVGYKAERKVIFYL